MMKKTTLLAALLAAAALLPSCKKTPSSPEVPLPGNEEYGKLARVTLTIQGSPQTKANPDRPLLPGNEDKLSAIEVFVFDQRAGSATFGLLESYKKADAAEISDNTATVRFNTSTGKKHIYVVANAKANAAADPASTPLAESIYSEADLLAAVSNYADNATASFIMTGSVANSAGSTEPELGEGAAEANQLTCQLRRLVARIKVSEIVADFTSPSLRKGSFKVTRIYLMNVAKQAKYFNGRWEDPFGVSAASGPNAGSAITAAANYPRIGDVPFKPAASVGRYYAFAVPAESGTAADGYHNWMDASAFNASSGVTLSRTESDAFTCLKYTSGNILYPTAEGSNRIEPMYHFYAYPNCAVPASLQKDVDQTTKVVIETELNLGDGPTKLYYPISVPYVQPNYAYDIAKVTIRRLGSTDPFHPVTTADCTFSITVRDWDTGDIQGQFNNESSAEGENDQFVI